jgi:hypothetical protein
MDVNTYSEPSAAKFCFFLLLSIGSVLAESIPDDLNRQLREMVRHAGRLADQKIPAPKEPVVSIKLDQGGAGPD